MLKRNITVAKTSRMDAAPAALLVQAANKYSSSIYVEQENKHINAKSIMGVMTLKIFDGECFTVAADGGDEEQAISEIEKLLTGK